MLTWWSVCLYIHDLVESRAKSKGEAGRKDKRGPKLSVKLTSAPELHTSSQRTKAHLIHYSSHLIAPLLL